MTITLSAISHFSTPFSQQNSLKRVVCLLVYTSSLSLHSLTLSSWTSVFSALLTLLWLRSLVNSVMSKTMAICLFLCYLIFKQHLTRLTSSSSLKHSFTLGFHNITLWWLWRCPTQVFLRENMLQGDSLQLSYP